jgi:tetratricopeptide (TPR) repeat protein
MKSFAMKTFLWLLLYVAADGNLFAADETNIPPPVTARDFYNAGTQLLAAKKFADAERMFQSALAAQDERVQPRTLFNLGNTRFADGVEILKKGPDAQNVSRQGRSAVNGGEQAARIAESALAQGQMDKMIYAYIAGRGARRELRAAEKAVQAAMDTYGKTLTRWQRADDDFKGAAELNPADTNATRNAKIVEQEIAKLVDSLRQMQQMLGSIGNQKQKLDQLLGKLKGQIPAPNAPPGSSGEDEDDEGNGHGNGDVKPESLAGKQEGGGRDGSELQAQLSPDQAGQLLDGLPVDGSKHLPMGGDQQGEPPKDKRGRTW